MSSACDVGEAKEGWRMNCDVGKATEVLENELWRRWSDGKVGEWAELAVIVIEELILQPFSHITYITTHCLTLLSLYVRHRSFFNPFVALPTSQLISNPSVAWPTSQALHLINLASRPCVTLSNFLQNKQFLFSNTKSCLVNFRGFRVKVWNKERNMKILWVFTFWDLLNAKYNFRPNKLVCVC